MEKVWVLRNHGTATPLYQRDIVVPSLLDWPTFQDRQGELPRDRQLRWHSEFQAIADQQHKHVELLLCHTLITHKELGLQERMARMSKVVQEFADWSAATQALSLFQHRVFNYKMSNVVDLVASYRLLGSAVQHQIAVSLLSPSEIAKL